MKCKICGKESKEIFKHTILDKYKIKYFRCSNCEFIQTEEAFWLKEAYSNTITPQDTGLIKRNIYYSAIIPRIIKNFFKKSENFLDYAGGYGVFTNIMRKKKFNFFWDDPYTTNIYAKEYKYKNQKIDLITCFECFEHFDNPKKDIKKMLKISKNIIFSTALLPKDTPNFNWTYYGFEHGQHIALYSIKTLQFISKKYNLNLNSSGNLHLLTDKKINPILFLTVVIVGKLTYKLTSKFSKNIQNQFMINPTNIKE